MTGEQSLLGTQASQVSHDVSSEPLGAPVQKERVTTLTVTVAAFTFSYRGSLLGQKSAFDCLKAWTSMNLVVIF